VDVTLSGNTAGVLALISSGTMTLAGGNNIVLSQAGNAVTISASAQSVQPETQTAISGIANSQTTYTSGTVSLSELGAITIRSTTGNQFQLSVNAQSVQPETQTFLAGLGNSETTYTSGTVNLSVLAGNLTIRSTTGQAFQFSMSQSVQAETQTAISGIANSQTTYTSGTVSLSELGAITIRSTTGNQFQFSVNSQTAQTGVSGIANSQTTYTSGTVSLSELGAITIRSTTGNQYQFSVNSQTVQTQNMVAVTLSGNTAGALALVSSGTLTLAGGNNITLSQAGNAVTISAPNLGAGAMSVGVSTGGNTQGNTGITGTRMVFVGTNNITLSQDTDANGGTISISGPAAGAFSAGMSTEGNTAGATGVTGTRVVFVGSGVVSLSQTTGAAGGTVSILAPATSSLVGTGDVSISTNASTISIGVPKPIMSYYMPASHLLYGVTQGIGASAATQTTVTAFVMPMSLPRDLAFNNMFLAVNNSFSSATTSISSVNYSYSMGASLGFYTLNASSMSLVTSFSGTLGFTNATSANATDLKATGIVGWGGSSQSIVITGAANMSSIMSSIQGARKMPLNWSTDSKTLTANQYWAVACFTQLTAGAANASLTSIGFVSSLSIMGSAFNPPAMMRSTASITSPYPFLGQATLVNSSNSLMPVSFNTNAITVSTNTNASTKFQSVWFQIYSSHSD
jgi:hypothetical protein